MRPDKYRTILAQKPRENYQVDLVVYDRYKDGKYKYILTCIDVYSRFAVAVPLKTREAGRILEALKHVFKEMGKPVHLNCDQEFYQSSKLKQFFDTEGVTLHVSDTDEINKNAIIERFHRTLSLLLKRWRDGTGKRNWHNILNSLVDNYNTSYHRTIKSEPEKVWSGKEENRQSPIHTFESEIDLGDLVRVKQLKKVFGKGDALKYSKELYKVLEKKLGREKKYKLEDVESGEVLTKPRLWFKDYELKQTSAIVERKPEEKPEKPEPTRQQRKLLKELETDANFGVVKRGGRLRSGSKK